MYIYIYIYVYIYMYIYMYIYIYNTDLFAVVKAVYGKGSLFGVYFSLFLN